jgi:hypothetical protein
MPIAVRTKPPETHENQCREHPFGCFQSRISNPEFIFETAYYEAHSINFLWLSDSCRPGYDPVWFSIVIGVTMMIGVITPPVAVAAFIVKNITQESIGQIYRGVVPFLITLVLSLARISHRVS